MNFGEYSFSNLKTEASTSKKCVENVSKNNLNKKCPETCMICRNSAIGYHYDVASCNGCKTFFRRTIISGLKYTCTKNRKCLEGTKPVDLSKRMCRSCRFEKCVAAGMNPLGIRAEIKNEQAKELRKQLIEHQTANSVAIYVPHISNYENEINKIIENLSKIEIKAELIRRSGLPLGYKDLRSLEEVMTSNINFNNSNIPNLIFSPPSFCQRSGELKGRSAHYHHSSLLAVVEWFKTFQIANEMDFEAKTQLMKQVAVKVSNMSNAFFSMDTLKSDKLLLPDGTEIFTNRSEKLFDNFRKKVQRTLQTFLRIKINRIEYILLKAIVLCNPAISGLTQKNQEILANERKKYVNCLLNYCLVQRGALNGPARFSELISIAPALENQQQFQKDFYLLFKISNFEKHKNLTNSAEKRISLLFSQIMDS